MQNINSNTGRVLRARGLAGQWAALAIGFSAAAWSGEALARTGQPLAYVTSFASNSISVIDTGNNTVVGTIPVGNGPEGIAVAPDGKHVYVAISTDNDLSVIDTTTDKVVKRIAVTGGAFLAAVTPDGKHAYVTGQSSVSVIDTTSQNVVATVPVAGASLGLYGIAVTPNGKRVYVTSDAGISVIDTTSNKVVATIPNTGENAGFSSVAIAIAPDGKHAYATNTGVAHVGCFISIIDTITNTMTFGTTLVVDNATNVAPSIAITPNGKDFYVPVAHPQGNNIEIFATETATNTVVKDISLSYPRVGSGYVAITPDGKRAYVAVAPYTADPSTLLVIDTGNELDHRHALVTCRNLWHSHHSAPAGRPVPLL